MTALLFEGSFNMAFKSEITKMNIIKLSNQIILTRMLPHNGKIKVYEDKIVLDERNDALEIAIGSIVSVRRGFDPLFKRRYFMGLGAGAAGGPGRVSAISGGEPIRISYKTKESESAFYIYAELNAITGFNKNKELMQVLNKVRSQKKMV